MTTDTTDTRTFEYCHLVYAPGLIDTRSRKLRLIKGGWSYARCLNCPVRLWIPPGGSYTFPDVCKRVAHEPPPDPRP